MSIGQSTASHGHGGIYRTDVQHHPNGGRSRSGLDRGGAACDDGALLVRGGLLAGCGSLLTGSLRSALGGALLSRRKGTSLRGLLGGRGLLLGSSLKIDRIALLLVALVRLGLLGRSLRLIFPLRHGVVDTRSLRCRLTRVLHRDGGRLGDGGGLLVAIGPRSGRKGGVGLGSASLHATGLRCRLLNDRSGVRPDNSHTNRDDG